MVVLLNLMPFFCPRILSRVPPDAHLFCFLRVLLIVRDSQALLVFDDIDNFEK